MEDANRSTHGRFSRELCMCFGRDANGKLFPRNASAARVQSINIFWSGSARACLSGFGARDWRNTMDWKGSRGPGRALTAQWSKRHWRWKRLVRTPRIGEKNGTKRSVLIDGNGIPLSFVVSGAERHDVKLLEPTLDKIVVVRPGSRQHLCADKGYMGKKALQIILERGYVPHVRQWGEEVDRSRKKKGYKPRRWKVERTHSWLNRYRKLLVRFEKLAASHEALLELACALTAFRRTITIYG